MRQVLPEIRSTATKSRVWNIFLPLTLTTWTLTLRKEPSFVFLPGSCSHTLLYQIGEMYAGQLGDHDSSWPHQIRNSQPKHKAKLLFEMLMIAQLPK